MTGQLPSFSAPVFTVKLLLVSISNFLMSTVHQRNPNIRRISTKQEQADRPSRQTYGGQEGGERLGREGPGIWDGQVRTMTSGWINTQSYCRARASTQYPVSNHNGKEYEKRIYIDSEPNQVVVQQKLIQHCKSTIP